MQEVWKDIKDYENIYQISNLGNVRSLDRKLTCGRQVKGKQLIPCGLVYLHVTLTKMGQPKNFNVHRLVAEAFIPNPENLPCINHKDEDKKNNCVNNLEWCTHGYNIEYSGIVEKASIAKAGKPLSEEHKQHLSDSLKKSGKQRALKRKLTMHNKYPNGFKHSEESKRLLSEKLTGRLKSEETKAKMRKPKSPEAIEHMRAAQQLRAQKLRKKRI